MTPKEQADELNNQFGLQQAIAAVDLLLTVIWGRMDEATENYWRDVLLELHTKNL